MPFFTEKNNTITLNIRVVPRASKNEIIGLYGDALKVRIQAPPVDGKANAYLIKFLSQHWKIPRRNIEILSGETGRNKRLKINNSSTEFRTALLNFKSNKSPS